MIISNIVAIKLVVVLGRDSFSLKTTHTIKRMMGMHSKSEIPHSSACVIIILLECLLPRYILLHSKNVLGAETFNDDFTIHLISDLFAHKSRTRCQDQEAIAYSVFYCFINRFVGSSFVFIITIQQDEDSVWLYLLRWTEVVTSHCFSVCHVAL